MTQLVKAYENICNAEDCEALWTAWGVYRLLIGGLQEQVRRPSVSNDASMTGQAVRQLVRSGWLLGFTEAQKTRRHFKFIHSKSDI